MTNRRVCITNNPLVREACGGVDFIGGGPSEVFIRARDLVHRGWVFVAHPAYGNFNPARHPYRTLVLSEPEGESPSVDYESFGMIEAVLEKLRDADGEETARSPHDSDYAMLDRELTKDIVLLCTEKGETF